MDTDQPLTRAADETAGRQPHEASPPGEAAAASQAPVGRRALRRYELERSRRTAMVMLNHLGMGIDGKLISTAQDSVDKLKDPFLAMNRMQRELRRIIAQEARLDDEDEKRAKAPVDADDEDENGDEAKGIDLALMASRRASRFDDLDLSQHFTMAMIDRLAKGVSGLLSGAAHDAIERLNDPFLAINRMQRELRRTIALAEQLDEDDAERAKRLAAEAAAEEEAARVAELYRAGAAEREKLEAKKAAIRRAVTDAARDAWGDDTDIDDGEDTNDDDDDDDDRESVKHLLADLFDDYETYEDYDRDPVEIVAKMCAELGLKPEAGLLDEADGDPEAAEKAVVLELARGYLDRAGWAVAPAEIQDERAPPDG